MQVWAHNAAPPAQLIGVRPCVQTSSVQLGLEASSLEVDAESVRRAVYDYLVETFTQLQIPYDELCPQNPSFVLLGIYARFLDPKNYVGFPPSSYTYVTTAQVGRFSPQPSLETVLSPARYATSASEIFQAADADALTQRLVALGKQQVDDLAKHWLEANAVSATAYLLFAGIGAALLALRGLPHYRLSR